jgi:hypothetical protein
MTMLKGLQVGFGSLIGADTLGQLRERGVQMFRLDCQPLVCEADLRNCVNEVLDAGMTPLVIIKPEQAWWLPQTPLDVEVLNEPDLAGMSPATYAQHVRNAYDVIRGRHCIWAGVISNLDKDSLAWLRESITYWPEDVNVSVHRYPPTGAGPSKAHKGFKQRENEVAELMGIIGNRQGGVSEFGYHTAKYSTGNWPFKKQGQLTDDQVAEYTAWEVRFWEQQGAAFACAYQINDGASSHYNDHFGWRDIDGTWKPVADTFRTV